MLFFSRTYKHTSFSYFFINKYKNEVQTTFNTSFNPWNLIDSANRKLLICALPSHFFKTVTFVKAYICYASVSRICLFRALIALIKCSFPYASLRWYSASLPLNFMLLFCSKSRLYSCPRVFCSQRDKIRVYMWVELMRVSQALYPLLQALVLRPIAFHFTFVISQQS